LVNGVWFAEEESDIEGRSFIFTTAPGEHHIGDCLFLLEDKNISDTATKFGEADM